MFHIPRTLSSTSGTLKVIATYTAPCSFRFSVLYMYLIIPALHFVLLVPALILVPLSFAVVVMFHVVVSPLLFKLIVVGNMSVCVRACTFLCDLIEAHGCDKIEAGG